MASLERREGLPLDCEDASFIIELLNGERFEGGMSSTEGSDAALGGNVGRDECETYVRVAEPKEQGVGSMFDEGLLDFVSNYRRSEGEKLRLMDEQNLKFATSQVLRRQQMYERGTTGEPDAGGIIGNKSPWSSSSRRGQMPAQMPVKHGPGDQHGLSNEHGYGYEQGREDDQRETPTRPLRAARDAVDHGPPTTKMSDGVFGCCRSNSRDADQDPKASGAANLREEHSGNRRGGTGRQVDGRSTKMHQGNGRVDPRHALPDGGSTSQCRTKESRRGTSMTKDYRNLSYKICMEGSQEHNNSRLRPVGKARTYLKGDETSLPIPSYALPTKHFKNTNRYNVNGSGVDAPREEIIHRWKLPQRQAQIDEEKTALKLRLEGQRRAIHELEHQANTLREDVRSREEDIKRLKRKLAAMSTSMKRESCSCRASTHHTRLRTGFDSGVATVMSRVKVAEEPMREHESHLAESKTREDRSREKGAFPECSHSGTQEKTAKLECDLAALRLALSEAKRELRQREKDPQFHVRDPDKLREHEAGGRNVEIARADAAESGARLRKMSKELDATRDEAKLLRLEMTQANARVGDLERENDMLQDRLRETSFLGKVRERDRAAHRVSARKEDSRTGDGPRTIGRRFEQTCHRSSSRTELTSGGFCDAKRTIATIRQASPECSTLSAGSSRTSMRERYEKLRAMYKKVNQRDTRIRGRAGVG